MIQLSAQHLSAKLINQKEMGVSPMITSTELSCFIEETKDLENKNVIKQLRKWLSNFARRQSMDPSEFNYLFLKALQSDDERFDPVFKNMMILCKMLYSDDLHTYRKYRKELDKTISFFQNKIDENNKQTKAVYDSNVTPK